MRVPFLILVWCCVSLMAAARADWPEFRGPWSNGHANPPGSSNLIGLPLTWSETNNVTWKTPIPFRGWSTPVIMNGQIWITTATEDGHDFYVLCVEEKSGKILLNKKLFHADAPEVLGNALNCYASPSATLESGRVYVHFGTYGTACLDTATFKVLWKREDIHCRHYRGPGSSPFLYGDLLILSFDGIDVQFISALDKKDGHTVWKTDRTADWNDAGPDGRPFSEGDLRKAYSTPIIVPAGNRVELVSSGSRSVYGYDPLTGKELWQVKHMGASAAPRPVFGQDLVFVSTGFAKTELLAIRPGGSGNVTTNNVVWRVTRGVTHLPSPVVVDDLIFMLADNGVVICLEAATGKEVWQERIGAEYAGSAMYGDGRIYCLGQDGKARVIKASRTYELLATNPFDGSFMSSPAVSGKALILRTKTNLYRVEETPAKP